jgi:hypothetical protein
MRKRKLQIFLSSTYQDLIDERLAAMEAILAAGHIPAAMEQFSPGDETAWEKIKTWIDESDAFILILGGRYGSIEPESGKSYVQLEYEYVVERKKPFFVLVVQEQHHEQRVKVHGLAVDERAKPEMYLAFKDLVKGRMCRFWSDKRDIQAAIFQKLPEWAQRPDLVGWVRADEAMNPEVMNELVQLSHENRELREKVAAHQVTFDGLTFDELVEQLRSIDVSAEDAKQAGRQAYMGDSIDGAMNLLELFMILFNNKAQIRLVRGYDIDPVTGNLLTLGLAEIDGQFLCISASGRQFRNLFKVQATRAK